MSYLAIKGHLTRGKEVIEILEMLGGTNSLLQQGCGEGIYFFDTYSTRIQYILSKDIVHNFTIFTLEEFLEKFPYKVEDKVKCWINGYCSINNIKDIRWDSIANEIKYKIQDYWYSTINLQPYKEETMEEQNEKSINHVYVSEVISFDIAPKDKYELDLQGKFEVTLHNGKYFVERIKPQYPKTYEECCKVLSLGKDGKLYTKGYKASLIQDFQKLLICRDAYWKTAGDWKYDVKKTEECFYIVNKWGRIVKDHYMNFNHILAFPTSEMRDIFYENFKELIELVKELL